MGFTGTTRRVRALATVAVLAAPSAACTPPSTGPTDPPDPTTGCDGAEILCGRAYDDVAYLTTHNAMATSAYGFLGPNQTLSFTGQLDAGVRGLMIDIWRNGDSSLPTPDASNDAILLCHSACLTGHRDLVSGLREIDTWMAAHPTEVVTLILENYVSAAALDTAFTASGLAARAATHALGTPWPTLQEMVDSGKRLVVLTDSQAGQRPWLLPAYQEAWDTNWSATVPSDLTCEVNRGSFSNQLIILNNFLTDPIALPALADQVNAASFLGPRIDDCRSVWFDRIPNFVTVDFVERGGARTVVRTLNGI